MGNNMADHNSDHENAVLILAEQQLGSYLVADWPGTTTVGQLNGTFTAVCC